MDVWRRRRRGPAERSRPSYVGDVLDGGALRGLGGGGMTPAEMKLGGKAGDAPAEGYRDGGLGGGGDRGQGMLEAGVVRDCFTTTVNLCVARQSVGALCPVPGKGMGG